MPNDKWEKVKGNVRKISDTVGLTEPNSHWIPIPGKAYDEMHPAIRSQRSGDRAEHLKQFNLSGPSNVVSINVARENRRLKESKGE
jgi:hypothetical protein